MPHDSEYYRDYYQKNKEKYKAAKARYRAKHKERVTEQERNYYKNNPEKFAAASKRYRKRFPKKVAELGAVWRAKNPGYESPHLQSVKGYMTHVKEIMKCQNPDCKWSGEYPPQMLEYHHVDREAKKFNLAVYRGKLGPLIDEMKKCTVLCSNCHRLERAGLLDATNFPRCLICPSA